MNLLQQIKSDRAQKKKKEFLRPTLFNRVSGLVKEYGLEESFLEKLESPEDFLQEKKAEFARVRKKQPFRIPLFSLSEQKEYSLTLAILDKMNNPYLEFAQSPEEIALSKLLFELNPSVETEKLERYHFETLLQYERAKINIKELAYRREMGPGVEKPNLENEGLLQDSLEKRMEQLESFIAKIEESQVK
ncbi:MAG: hypothetical protein JSV47_14925 [Deltaproteobacteria bacterium]|nr:MAG: hypothetical protein JSV47_14925 [Deltaproteobacteria bacterium]